MLAGSFQHGTLLPPPHTSTTGHCFHFGLASSFWSSFSPHSSSVAYWTLTDLGGLIFQCHIFSLCHGVLEARIPKWFAIAFSSRHYSVRTVLHDPSVLGGHAWHGMAWLITSLNYIRLWSFWLAFCDCVFHSGGCGIIVLASWWEGLTVGKTGSCSGEQSNAQ